MKRTPARLRLAVSPLMVAVALGLLGPNALADETDKELEEAGIKPVEGAPESSDTEVFSIEATGGLGLSSEAELELLGQLQGR